MKWKCKTCGCEEFNQEWVSKRKFDKCLFDKEGYRRWYSTYRDTDEMVVVCSDCGAVGKKIYNIAEWGGEGMKTEESISGVLQGLRKTYAMLDREMKESGIFSTNFLANEKVWIKAKIETLEWVLEVKKDVEM